MTVTTKAEPAKTDEPKTFEVVFLSPSALKPYFRNSKKHDRAQILQLAKAIRTMGFDQPIVVDGDMVIIKGHGRRLASLELKLDLVPVVIRTDLTPMQVVAARIADNRSHNMSETDAVMERAEVADYIDMGGSDAGSFFDFMGKTDIDPTLAGAGSPTPKAEASVAGSLLTCPKCGASHMESK